jgi:polar amino acid transport system substrate-binding protein
MSKDVKFLAAVGGIGDLNPPRKVGSVQGSADAPGLLAQIPNVDIQYFQDDAMLTASMTLARMSKDDPSLVVVMPPFKPDPWAIGVRHNDSKWRLAIQDAVVDAWADGTTVKLHQEHIGTPVNFTVPVWPDYYAK